MIEDEVQAAPPLQSGRPYGWIIIVGSLLTLAGMLRHPAPPGSGVMETVRWIVEVGAFNQWVHGFLIAVILVLIAGFHGFSGRLTRSPVLGQVATILYAAGGFAGICAAIAAGFAMRSIAVGYLNATPDQEALVSGLLRVLGAFNFAWGRVWIVATSAAILLWSIALLRQSKVARMPGFFGLLAGGVPAVGIVSGLLPLNVPGTIGAIAAHVLWSLWVGYLLVRSRL